MFANERNLRNDSLGADKGNRTFEKARFSKFSETEISENFEILKVILFRVFDFDFFQNYVAVFPSYECRNHAR